MKLGLTSILILQFYQKYNLYLMNQIITNKLTGAQYKLVVQVGKGANAKVYKGENVVTKKIVAIKRMNNMMEKDANMAKKEVQLMKCLNHKNIVKWVDDFRDKGIWYIVLEYCGNGDLQTYKNRTGKIPEYNCKALVRGVLEALVQIHTEKKIVVEVNKKKTQINKKKIAHRDLKLANILIDDNFQLKLADFGFSKDFQNAWMTTWIGSPITMAPQVVKHQNYDQKCDVWSLGIITYYLLYNVYPFWPVGSQANNYNALVNLILNSKHTFDPNVQVSEAGKDFINQCLIKSKKQRPNSQQLLDHQWWANLSKGVKWSDIRSETIKMSLDQNYEKQAEAMLMNVFYGVCEQHTNKLINGYLINEEEIKQILPLFSKYYSKSKYIDYYCHLIVKKLHQLKNREIMLSIEKLKFTFTLAQIKQTEIKFVQTLKLVGDLNAVGEVNMAEELAIFLSEETEKLLNSFNQDEVNEKIILFRQLARFLTTSFDFTLIKIDWGKNEELKELQSPIYNIILKLTSSNVVDMINRKERTNKDLEAIWTIQHHISQSNDQKRSFEQELGRLVLKILEVPSNFNIDKTMQTDLLEMKPYQFNQIGFLNYQ